ncbi:uncharacterized protein HD556DRAFT_1223255 [Suillus plorans]|uniref:Uncharacterized protein n=1 Tax=Suillus plorans TaxID=116603 RepID=A0A9P7J9X5_9AGAM|nr:uncharacterized protein HD556DRAFT_1223255 [Suillus plorans]KAG1810200.1 hypothetical protein HD556DRAFT_1223255 [Suillus plorans]
MNSERQVRNWFDDPHDMQTTTASTSGLHSHPPPTEVPSPLRSHFQIVNLWHRMQM